MTELNADFLRLASELSPSMRQHLLGEPHDYPVGRSYSPNDQRTVRALIRRGLARSIPRPFPGNWMWEPTDLGIAVEMVLRNMDTPAYPPPQCRSCGAPATLLHYPERRPGRRAEFTARAYGTCDEHAGRSVPRQEADRGQ